MEDWVYEHWFLTFILIYVTIEFSFKIFNRILRTIKVSIRGWPPSHLDADGDWNPKAPPRGRGHQGFQGHQGVQGSQGAQGTQGTQSSQGVQGNPVNRDLPEGRGDEKDIK